MYALLTRRSPLFLARMAGLAALLSTSACNGWLFLDASSGARCTTSAECGYGSTCDARAGLCVRSEGACSAVQVDGDCGPGQLCSGGICLCVDAAACVCEATCLSAWCECADGQGCDAGVCTDIVTDGPNANSCAPTRPDGLCANEAACCGGSCCPGGEVCVAGHCIPNERPCSLAEPNGWCGAGLGCSSGRCEPLAQCACSPNNTRGCCEDGAACDGGTCVAQACRAGVAGGCGQDEICRGGVCERLPCLPGHVGGLCASGFCSVVGACVPLGTCGGSGDCALNEFCGADDLCRPTGTCQVDDDCTLQLGRGHLCIGGTCGERETCTSSSDCIEDKFCSSAGNCLAQPRCDGTSDCDADQFCSGNGQCVATGCCGADSDCGNGRLCVERGVCDVCIDEGTCQQAGDCPPAYLCNTTSNLCELTGEVCDSNDFTANCGPGIVSCCAPGADCCSSGDICSTVGRCIDFGRCVTSGDCVDGFACVDFVCQPRDDETCPCGPGKKCATAFDRNTCIPEDKCASNSGCAAGSRCNAEHECEPDATCGAEQLTTGSFVPPNVLIVFDRSGSMNICGAGDPTRGHCGYNYGTCSNEAACNGFDSFAIDGNMECTNFGTGNVCTDDDCDFGCANPPTCSQTTTITRWRDALTAIIGDDGNDDIPNNGDDVPGLVDTYLGQVRFGLSIYPRPSPSDACATECNWFSCTGGANLTAGAIDVAVGLGTRSAIENALGDTAPGGSTPTAPTLRALSGLPDRGGLNSPDRPNAVLLVTDGEPTGDTANVLTCEPPCGDGVRNGDETGRDCGGQCPPCLDTGGDSCNQATDCDSGACVAGVGCEAPQCDTADDCLSHVCREGQCRPTSCANEVQDAGETSTDCGGPCQRCTEGLACALDADCASGVCSATLCAPARCDDGLLNGSETGVDCGGGCTTACVDGARCIANDDCVSGFCGDEICRPLHCQSSTQNGDETGVDCGGSCKACVTACTNGVRDGNETDIDCGGGTCPDCGGARTCVAGSDCLSNTCTACTTPGAQGCRVNAAIDRLYALEPRVKTYVVGFQLSGSANLNCNAVHGKTADQRIDGCAELTRETCDDPGAPTCYYEATDAAALQTALDDVIQNVSSCRFSLSEVPPDFTRLFVYLVDAGDPENREEIFRGIQWSYDYSTNQVEFFGSACGTIRSGARTPVIVYGCRVIGG